MTTSTLDAKNAWATPTILHLPPDAVSSAAATEAIEWGEAFGLHLDASQQETLHAALGERSDGSWAAGEVADIEGRQAGKNDTAKVRQGAGIDLFGERLIIHTAHEFPTANEDFIRLVAIYEAYDELRKTVQRIRWANGEQGIEFINGARIKYRARTGGSGRGFTKADVVFYDECQQLPVEHLAASMPTMLANPNFQAWFMGSGGLSTSSQAWKLRRRALSGNGGRLAYVERTAESIEMVDGEVRSSVPDDLMSEEALMTHAGFASGRVTLDAMRTMYDALGPELFAREVLCVWDPEPSSLGGGPIPISVWDDLTDAYSTPDPARCSLALDTNPERTWFTFCLAGERADGLVHVEVTKSHPDKREAVLMVKAAADKLGGAEVAVSDASGLAGDLTAAGVKVHTMKTGEQAAATSALIDATRGTAPLVRHRGEPVMRRAIEMAQSKPYGDGGVIWSRRTTSGDISPLTALTMAYGRLGSNDEPTKKPSGLGRVI